MLDESTKKLLNESAVKSLIRFENHLQNIYTIYYSENLEQGMKVFLY